MGAMTGSSLCADEEVAATVAKVWEKPDPAEPGSSAKQNHLLDRLYRLHFQDLCANIYKSFGPGPPEPEEVVQTAYAKYVELAEPEKISNPRAFLYIAARNIVLDHKRRLKVFDSYAAEQIAFEKELGLEEITPERVVLAKERFDVLVEVIKKLPKKQQVVLTMSRLEGKPYREIAKETGWSPADISRQMQAGMTALVRALKAHDGPKD